MRSELSRANVDLLYAPQERWGLGFSVGDERYRVKDFSLDADALTRALKAKIANFKVPKAVFVVAELPRNAMGKVQKHRILELL